MKFERNATKTNNNWKRNIKKIAKQRSRKTVQNSRECVELSCRLLSGDNNDINTANGSSQCWVLNNWSIIIVFRCLTLGLFVPLFALVVVFFMDLNARHILLLLLLVSFHARQNHDLKIFALPTMIPVYLLLLLLCAVYVTLKNINWTFMDENTKNGRRIIILQLNDIRRFYDISMEIQMNSQRRWREQFINCHNFSVLQLAPQKLFYPWCDDKGRSQCPLCMWNGVEVEWRG